MYDIIFIGNDSPQWKALKSRFKTAKRADSFEKAQKKAFTKMFWVVWDDLIVSDNFNFDYEADDWSLEYVHTFLNGDHHDGIILVPKNANISSRELQYRFFVNKKEVDIVASTPKTFDIFYIDTYEDYLTALENSSTEMFWAVSHNLKYDQNVINNFYISHHNSYDRKENHVFVHLVNDVEHYNGVFLCSKNAQLSKREIEYRFLVNRKEWDIVASSAVVYEKFYADTYEDYLLAIEKSKTELFWVIPSDIILNKDFKFDVYFTHDNNFDRKINHVFLNGKYHDGVILCSKYSKIARREWEYRFITHKKEHDILASSPKPYDIVFISYNELNADENFVNLWKKFPRAKRVHGVKGIHNAHIEAAKKSETEMFWIVDGDALIVDEFNFDYQVPKWKNDQVFVWHSRNPINDLEYGYGGVKLFPKKQTLAMDANSTDMSTSISPKFNVVDQVSNITAFNTGEFETWKSAFRECAKLASGIINRQEDNETEQRLQTWCTVDNDREFSKWAISGACAGREFGYANRDNKSALALINDFDWLKKKFNE